MKRIIVVIWLSVLSVSVLGRGVPQGGSGNAGSGVELVRSVEPLITGGVSFLNSSLSDTWGSAFHFAGGVSINSQQKHLVSYYHSYELKHDSYYEPTKMWGITYDYFYMFDFDTDFIYFSPGIRMGYMKFDEVDRYKDLFTLEKPPHGSVIESTGFGAPMSELMIRFGQWGFAVQYGMPLGIREVDSGKQFSRSDIWSVQLVLHLPDRMAQ